MSTANAPRERPRQRRCPNCGKPSSARYRPFCSAACRDRDWLNWLDGRYAIPATESEPDDDGPEHGAR
jgi:endogenous inhibitor of DNA gyrase (YacG/DUF329 family)